MPSSLAAFVAVEGSTQESRLRFHAGCQLAVRPRAFFTVPGNAEKSPKTPP
jgi:hypothetical protein